MVDFRKAHGDTKAGRCGSPAARPDQNSVLIPKLQIQVSNRPGYGILLLFGQGEVWLHFDENRISHGDGRIPAHEVAANMPQGILHLGLYAGLSDPVGLYGAALQQIDPIVSLRREVARILDIYRIVVFFRDDRHDALHNLGKIRAPQELLEIDDIRDTFVVQSHLPEAGGHRRVRLHKQGRIRMHGILAELFQRQGKKGIVRKTDHIDLVLAVAVFVAVFHHLRSCRRVQVDETGIVVRFSVHRTRSHSKNHSQHAAVFFTRFRPADIQVFGMADTAQVRVVILAVNITADAHDQKSHLFVPVQKLPVRPIADRLGAHRACVNPAHSVLKHLIPLLQRPLVGAENAFIFSRKSIADAILQQGTGADNDR